MDTFYLQITNFFLSKFAHTILEMHTRY